MRYGVWILLALCVLSLATGCGRSDGTVTALPTQMLQPADSPVPTATPHTVTIDPTPVCPPARGIGTVSPAVSISSITFLVNGLEQVVYGDDMLQAAPGDRVQVTDAIICAGTFSGKGGEACVDFAPVDQSGQEIFPEHKGTHLVPVAPGLIVISDLDVAWTISEDWSGISAVLNHWTPENTQDLGCASERCERDDRIMVELHSPAAISFDTVEQVELLSTLSGHRGKVVALAFSGDELYVASSSQDNTIKLWDLQTAQEVHSFTTNEMCGNNIAFSPDGSLLASADAIWDVKSRQVVHTLEQGRQVPGPVALSPDGSLFAVALVNQPIKLWDVAGGQVVRIFDSQTENLARGIAFSPDGALLAASGNNGTVRLWDVASGQIVGTLEHGNDSHVYGVAFSPDGRVLVSGGTDYTVRIWNVASRQVIQTLSLGDDSMSLALSPNGTILASAGRIGLQLWNVKNGERLRILPHNDELMAVAFSSDGTLLASAGHDTQIYLWGIRR